MQQVIRTFEEIQEKENEMKLLSAAKMINLVEAYLPKSIDKALKDNQCNTENEWKELINLVEQTLNKLQEEKK